MQSPTPVRRGPTAAPGRRPPPLRTPREEHAAFVAYRETGDPVLREALVRRFVPLARRLASRHPGGSDQDDVQQIALIGLMKAVDRFDPDRGAAFSSFAAPTILGEVKRYFRDHGWTVRVPRSLQERVLAMRKARDELSARLGRAPTAAELAEALDCTAEEVVEALTSETAHRPLPIDTGPEDEQDGPSRTRAVVEEPGYRIVEAAGVLEPLLARLPDQERETVVLRFRDDLLQREIAERIGVSQMQVSRLLRSGVARLQQFAGETA